MTNNLLGLVILSSFELSFIYFFFFFLGISGYVKQTESWYLYKPSSFEKARRNAYRKDLSSFCWNTVADFSFKF